MRYEDPNRSQTQVEERPDGLKLTFSRPINFFPVLFLVGWMVAWFFGESFAVKQLIQPTTSAGGANLFLFGWLIAWTAGGAMAFYTLMWQVAGCETVKITQTDFLITKTILGIPISRRAYLLADVKWLRVLENDVTSRNGIMQQDGDTIAFNYGLRTVVFFRGIDEAEGRDLRDRMAASNVWLKAAASSTLPVEA